LLFPWEEKYHAPANDLASNSVFDAGSIICGETNVLLNGAGTNFRFRTETTAQYWFLTFMTGSKICIKPGKDTTSHVQSTHDIVFCLISFLGFASS